MLRTTENRVSSPLMSATGGGRYGRTQQTGTSPSRSATHNRTTVNPVQSAHPPHNAIAPERMRARHGAPARQPASAPRPLNTANPVETTSIGPIVLPPELRPRARSRLQKMLHPFTPPTKLQHAVESERQAVKEAIKALRKEDIDGLFQAAYATAKTLHRLDYPGSELSALEFGLIVSAGVFANNKIVNADKMRPLSGKVDEHPWIPLEVISEISRRDGIEPEKAVSVWASLINEGLAQRAFEPDLTADPPELISVVRLLALPSYLKRLQPRTGGCTIL